MRCSWAIATLLATCAVASPASSQCTDDTAVWSVEHAGITHLVYGLDGFYFSTVYVEEWRESKLAWRTKSQVTCSNGVSTCYLMVDNAVPDDNGETSTTDVVIEAIDDNHDGLSERLILAGLYQSLHYAGGAKVEWFNGFKPVEDERPTAPNIYKFLKCQDGPVTSDK